MTEIGVGMLGYAFMGKAHSHALKSIGHMTWPAPLEPRLVSIAGRSEAAVAEAAGRYGFDSWTTDWHEVVADDRVGLFDNCGPNALHAEPTIAAAEAGKHVICEKPLGMNADESYEIWQRVEATGVKHACGFNYRFVPAVRLARQILEAGELGEIRHFRGRYLQDWRSDAAPKTWRLDSAEAGTGAIGDLGTHVIDLARYLVGEIASISALTRTFIDSRGGEKVDVDDAFVSIVELDGGVPATIEATRFAVGRKNALDWEINGSKGSLAFEIERPNELHLSRGGDGFARRLVTEPTDPFIGWWWPPGHMIGWGTPSSTSWTTCSARSPAGRGGAARRDVRGRRPRGRDLRRDRPLGRDRPPRDDQLPLTAYPVSL